MNCRSVKAQRTLWSQMQGFISCRKNQYQRCRATLILSQILKTFLATFRDQSCFCCLKSWLIPGYCWRVLWMGPAVRLVSAGGKTYSRDTVICMHNLKGEIYERLVLSPGFTQCMQLNVRSVSVYVSIHNQNIPFLSCSLSLVLH